MARGDQLGRQWRVLQALITSKGGKSAAELADELECHPRTVYRDLEALQIAGFPIYTDREDGKSLWSLLDTVKHQIPIPFTLTELMALYFSRDMLKVFKHTHFHDSLESLFKKVKATLPKKSLGYLDEVEQVLHVGLKPYKEYGKFREIINQVNEAALEKRRVEILYYAMSQREKTKRKVDPYRIWFFNGTFYLIGFCHLRNEIRTFALDRIRMLSPTEETFAVPEDFKLEDFLRSSFGVFRGKPGKVKIRFAPEVAGYIQEKVWHESQKIRPQKDGSLLFEAEVAGTDEIKYWIMTWGAKAEVLEPASLREEIRREAAEILGRYEATEKKTRYSIESLTSQSGDAAARYRSQLGAPCDIVRFLSVGALNLGGNEENTMAHMIPDAPPEFGPGMGAETALYEALESQLPDDFFVYHGLRYLEAERAAEGEADFLILHREHGLLSVECKGKGVRRTGTGQWFRISGDGREQPLKEDPFQQAQRTVKGLVKELASRLEVVIPRLEGRLPFFHGHAVAFPYAFVDELNLPLDVQRRIVIDASDMSGLEQKVLDAYDFWKADRPDRTPLEKWEFNAFRKKVLHPKLHLAESLGAQLELNTQRMIRLTEEQVATLRGVISIPRIKVSGGAGTGKTVLGPGSGEDACEQGDAGSPDVLQPGTVQIPGPGSG